jgi:hypothetical protein
MAKQVLPSLPNLNEGDDLVQWARELVARLQAIMLGQAGQMIDGRAIVDQSIPAIKMKP